MRTCENCSIRKQYAKCFDVHFDWRDCPYACEYAKEQVKEEMKRSEANAGDSISRQAAIEHLKKRLYETALNNDTELPYYEEMADNRVSVWLEEVPTIDPVKHGKWIVKEKVYPDLPNDSDYRYECSLCGWEDQHNEKMIVPYCWHCGARMDL